MGAMSQLRATPVLNRALHREFVIPFRRLLLVVSFWTSAFCLVLLGILCCLLPGVCFWPSDSERLLILSSASGRLLLAV